MKVYFPEKLDHFSNIKAILFDWDGVFHSGYKNHLGESLYSEADSMGLNMLRLGYYLKNGDIPYTGIITGEKNPTAHYLAEREHLNGLFYNVKDKKVILNFLKEQHNIEPNQVMFVFDDILDLSLAQQSGIRFMVNRDASKILKELVAHEGWTDFSTHLSGDEHAVRAICEFALDCMTIFKETINCRVEYGEVYQTYFKKRQEIHTQKMTVSDFQLVGG
ncbi:hypothetical protein [Parvicella tangerina]|uniref:Phosphatase n=1 Tax=Parvicella tangerina TaxID=2829795 RepID=A0A916JL24_9FLAO|nr:hypothetical protein [Parvicella tangerina]CAG5080273.1 hypothetical protein CRYO30217_01241 [Parvicella tangerina]